MTELLEIFIGIVTTHFIKQVTECQIVPVMLGGRFWEIGDPNSTGEHKPTQLPTGDGGVWWERAVASGFYETGQTPQLGAVICFYDNNGGAGHVAIVEQIDPDGTILCSNSAWQSTFFWISTITPDANNKYNWSHYTFQGFIYNPYADQPIPPTPTKDFNKWNFYLNCKKKIIYKGR